MRASTIQVMYNYCSCWVVCSSWHSFLPTWSRLCWSSSHKTCKKYKIKHNHQVYLDLNFKSRNSYFRQKQYYSFTLHGFATMFCFIVVETDVLWLMIPFPLDSFANNRKIWPRLYKRSITWPCGPLLTMPLLHRASSPFATSSCRVTLPSISSTRTLRTSQPF